MNETIRQAGLVFMGAGMGGTARFLIGEAYRGWMARGPEAFPWATLLINVTGCVAIGLMAQAVKGDARALLITGVLGGYTTFSAFGREAVEMWSKGATLPAALYVAASVVFGIGGTALGVWLAGQAARPA